MTLVHTPTPHGLFFPPPSSLCLLPARSLVLRALTPNVTLRTERQHRRVFGAAPLGSEANSRRCAVPPREKQRPGLVHYSRSDLLDDVGNDAGADSLAALADGELEPLVEGDRVEQLDLDGDVVAGHGHLDVLGEGHGPGHVRGTDEELRAVVLEEGRVPASLLLGEDVNLGGELFGRLQGAWLAQDLASGDLLTLDTTQQDASVVAGLALVEALLEHLDARARGLLRRLDPAHLHLVAHFDDPRLHAARHHRATARDGEHVLHRHQEVLLEGALGLGDEVVDGLHELENAVLALGRLSAVDGMERRALDDRGGVAVVLVERK
mmetsp:Transcript_43261/g.102182  ORF Transcript_43261/g.102182 Transcript_43261/m.102182 type:complete len:323 (+) Transcript_43261:243-1211(+)